MKKWGLVVTLLYTIIVLALLVPAMLLLVSRSTPAFSDFLNFYRNWGAWIIVGFGVLCQVALLAVSVDTTQKRMRSRTPIIVSTIVTAILLTIITAVVLLSSILVVTGEKNFPDLGGGVRIWLFLGLSWVVWAVLFYLLYRDSDDPVTRALAWLFRGSVLELLVAVPSHVIVRRRHDCCAPAVTGFGITSGIAIMLISFGPSVLLLFKKRMEKYAVRDSAPNERVSGV